MYGQPSADYKLVGDVKDQKGNPIEGIRVVVAPRPESVYDNDTLYSDRNGHFEKERLIYSWPDDLKDVKVVFTDVDGVENGSFKTKELLRSSLEVKQTGKADGDWYDGAFTVKADAVLEEDR